VSTQLLFILLLLLLLLLLHRIYKYGKLDGSGEVVEFFICKKE